MGTRTGKDEREVSAAVVGMNYRDAINCSSLPWSKVGNIVLTSRVASERTKSRKARARATFAKTNKCSRDLRSPRLSC